MDTDPVTCGASVTTGTGNILLGTQGGNNINTGNNNLLIGNYTQGSTGLTSNEIVLSTNGTSTVPVLGKGSNTAFIDARSGIYYYLPAYGSYSRNGSGLWNANTSAGVSPLNITVSSSSNNITFSNNGLYMFSCMANYLNIPGIYTYNVAYYLNGVKQPETALVNNTGSIGDTRTLNLSSIFRITSPTQTLYVDSDSATTSYLWIRYIGV